MAPALPTDSPRARDSRTRDDARADSDRDHAEGGGLEDESESGFMLFHGWIEIRHIRCLRPTRKKSMNSSTQDKAKGTVKEAVGKVKEKTGEVIGNPDLQDRGTAEKVEGKVQQKVGDVKKVFEK